MKNQAHQICCYIGLEIFATSIWQLEALCTLELFKLHNTCWLPFTNGETDAQKREGICPESHKNCSGRAKKRNRVKNCCLSSLAELKNLNKCIWGRPETEKFWFFSVNQRSRGKKIFCLTQNETFHLVFDYFYPLEKVNKLEVNFEMLRHSKSKTWTIPLRKCQNETS